MDIVGLATLPLRVTIAATRTTLALGQLASSDGPILRQGGYAARVGHLIGEDGLLEQLLEDEGILAQRLPGGRRRVLAPAPGPDDHLG